MLPEFENIEGSLTHPYGDHRAVELGIGHQLAMGIPIGHQVSRGHHWTPLLVTGDLQAQ